MNLWSYDLNNGSRKQLTYYTDFDIQFPASGPADTYMMKAKLYSFV
ncbi:MAG: hypothetical protein IPL97_12925 [Niastella sp.]|nr:hypothetical protein [Niastella sp.]